MTMPPIAFTKVTMIAAMGVAADEFRRAVHGAEERTLLLQFLAAMARLFRR